MCWPRKIILTLLLLFSCLPALAKEKTIVIPDVNVNPNKAWAKKTGERIQTTHIPREQIAETPVVNLTELLRQEQSIVRVTESSSDPTQTALSLRGFGDNAVANSLILVDGFPLTHPSLLAPNFNSIPLSDIERIDIFQGSEGILWGNQAVGGVVNIITRHPKGGFVDTLMGVGSFNKAYFSLLGADKFQNGTFLKAYGFSSKTSNYRDHSQQTNDNVAAQAGLDYARGTLSVYLQSYNNTSNFPGGITEQQFYDNPRAATDFNSHAYYRTQLIRLLSKHAINDQWLLETRLAYQHTDGNGWVTFNYDREDALGSISPRLIGTFYGSKITLGYDGQRTRFQLHNTKIDSRVQTQQNNLYGQGVIPLTATLDLTLGARAAQQQNTIESVLGSPYDTANRIFVTEQGLAYHPNQIWSFFLRRDGNFSFPKANEILTTASSTLDAQTGTSYETGAERRTEKQRSQISLYRLDLDNEIAYDPTPTALRPFGAFNNLDKTRRYGITLTESYQFTPKLLLASQLNYVNARFAAGPQSGKDVPAVPAFTGNLNINYAFTPKWQTKYGLLYTGTRYASDDVNNMGRRVPGYWLNNASLQYQLFKEVMMSAEIINLFDVHYSTYTYYNARMKMNTYYPAAGRNYLFTVKAAID